jgi:hypothetical protein
MEHSERDSVRTLHTFHVTLTKVDDPQVLVSSEPLQHISDLEAIGLTDLELFELVRRITLHTRRIIPLHLEVIDEFLVVRMIRMMIEHIHKARLQHPARRLLRKHKCGKHVHVDRGKFLAVRHSLHWLGVQVVPHGSPGI